MFSDSVGADLLTAIASLDTLVRERHDFLEFASQSKLRHEVRVTIGLDAPALVAEPYPATLGSADGWAPGGAVAPASPVIVPLATLDRRGQAAPRVRDEGGKEVPLLTSFELGRLLGGGLVAFGSRALGERSMSAELELLLRRLPLAFDWERHVSLDARSRQALDDEAFGAVQQQLLAFEEGFTLLRTLEFMQALKVASSTMPLVVLLDPREGVRRILTLSFERSMLTTRELLSGYGHEELVRRPKDAIDALRFVGDFWRKGGTADVFVPVGVIGGCERYLLEVDAPPGTWFAQGRVGRMTPTGPLSRLADCSQRFRLTYDLRDSAPSIGFLTVNVRALPTGLVRIALIGARFTVLCLVLGLLRVVLSPDHTFFAPGSGTAASVLLLFPGLAAASLITPAKHGLAARLQYPFRLLIWWLAGICFAVAMSSALGLDGWTNVVMWAVCVLAALAAATGIDHRVRLLRGIVRTSGTPGPEGRVGQ